ncbi:MAG: hypothetical protein ACM3NQ_15775, partial [Bacteroidales bacterium]
MLWSRRRWSFVVRRSSFVGDHLDQRPTTGDHPTTRPTTKKGFGRVKRLRIGVIYGGRSGEHEISIASAAAVVANLDRDRYEAVP